jgi:hypothetical protein
VDFLFHVPSQLLRQLDTYLKKIKDELKPFEVEIRRKDCETTFAVNAAEFTCQISDDNSGPLQKGIPVMPMDLLVREPGKVAGLILAKLHLNKVIFARNCEIRRIEKEVAQNFLDNYHLMNSTTSAFNFGLFHKDELIAVAAFSKGRKMDRLKENERSFELIRFCSKKGISIAGGLTKLLDQFIREKKAGDIMTYVDLQLSDGSSFVRAGFKRHSETLPQFFLVNRETYERTPLKDKQSSFDKKKFYLMGNSGNIKLIYKAKIRNKRTIEP